MQICNGKSAYGGIAIGKIKIFHQKKPEVTYINVPDCKAEIERFHHARTKAISQLQELYEKVVKDVGKDNASIFEIHQMMLDDLDYIESVENIIDNQSSNAEFAVATTSENFATMFASMEDAYMRERAADVIDISERVIAILSGNDNYSTDLLEPTIILANDLAPSETVQLDKSKVTAFVTVHGSTNSHTAILARTMNIPALVKTNIFLDSTLDGTPAIVDGFNGKLYINPEQKILDEMKAKQAIEIQKRQMLQELKGKETITRDGRKILLYANIGNTKDIESVLENDAEGIGLFRSEFLYLEKDTYPSEDEQFEAYRFVAEAMKGKRVIIRTLDIGADKQASYFNLANEENPALGYRAIRICLTRPDIFKTQLKALFRASIYGKIAIMYPMITSLIELQRIKEIVNEVKEELKNKNIPFNNNIEQGIMIETPASAIISDLLAKEVDFFSIGTNDLSQYTLAIDRQNTELDTFFDSHHEAILRLIKMTIDHAHKNNIWCGICGELGADLTLTETFLSMGIDELSVSAPAILPIRKKIREINMSHV